MYKLSYEANEDELVSESSVHEMPAIYYKEYPSDGFKKIRNYVIHDSGDYNVTDYNDPGVFADDWWDEFSDTEDEEEGWSMSYDYWEEYN